ncbi:MAG TPA: TonB-dependent receptor [Polyangiaceae bacterium]|nr:TonB-dependent receptor [Polyangiaceae bacterium]
MTLPRLLDASPPAYPAGEVREVDVVLVVVIAETGALDDAAFDSASQQGSPLEASAAEAFVQSALEAVRGYRFEPARRDGQPIRARIRIPFAFRPTLPVVASAPARESAGSANEPAPEPHVPSSHALHGDDAHLEVTVHGDRPLRTERRAASDYFLHREQLEAAPHLEGVDALRTVPGLSVFRTEGLASAPSYSLRGFDSEHGQDIQFSVGGLPINLPSHIHGQGYADLGFLIGDVVDELRVSEGVSDPKQGDFSVAGSLDVGLGVDGERRGLTSKTSYGSFDTFRQLLVWAPKEAARESFGAASYTSTSGYGENRAGQAASGIIQHRFGEGPLSVRFVGFAHGASAGSAGVVRRDDINAGVVCFTCVYPYATARAQGTTAQRVMAGFFVDYRGPEHASGSLGLWVGRDDYRGQQNFTGFLEKSQTLPLESGRGDLIEQLNVTDSVGLLGRYRTEAFEPTEWAHGTVEVGSDARLDFINQQQNLLDASVRNQTWDRRVDAGISALDVGLWGDLDWMLGEKWVLRAGARADFLSYIVDDRLGNRPSQDRDQDSFWPGYRRSASGVAFGPRASIEYEALPWMTLLGSYGEGYRSPQARLLADGESAPFTKVWSGDVGARFRLDPRVELSLAGYLTRLSDDVAFDASEGSLSRIGATERLGGTFYSVVRPTDWMLTSLSATYVHAVLLEPPPATAEEPSPPFVPGQPVPYVPPLVIRLDSSATRQLVADVAGKPLVGRVGLGLSFLAGRPLPYGQTAVPVGLLDASAGVSWGPLQFGLEGYNLLDSRYAASEYSFVSNWSPNEPSSRLPARHIAAGAPLTLLGTLGVTL